MNPNPNLNPKGRSRGRGGSGGGGGNKKPGMIRSTPFEGNGAPQRARGSGNAHQMMEKYLALARDATSQGDRVLAENYFQHADHYYRVMSSSAPPPRPQRPLDSQPVEEAEAGESTGSDEGQDAAPASA